MLLGVVLLYVGAVLAVNGIWLVGQARAAVVASREASAMDRATAAVGGRAARATYGGGAAEPSDTAAAQELGGEVVVEPPGKRAEAAPFFIQNREVAVLNIFTAFVGIVGAIIYIVVGATATVPGPTNPVAALNIRGGAFILLFAFTYLWVASNQYLNAGGRAFGWYCLFVAITAVPAGIFIFSGTGRGGLPLNTAWIWLGVDWFAWAVLWALFFAVLALDRALSRVAVPLAYITGALAIAEGIGTSWALAFALLEGKLSFL
jgi:putative amide transporter protein